MAKKTIMLVCSAGMSTSLLVSKMQKAATAEDYDSDIYAISSSEFEEQMEKHPADVVLLGPQVRFLKDDFTKKLAPKGVPVDVINMADYGLMNGEKVLAQAKGLMK
ncbi:PTS sugar transporter subunit IIB [Enterococcus timonensis]|uniref:PTS sugar transporter subunit IIB n=1 Tax=Enterococcus timonensis TaxID=1852364 RepID=UPI0008D9ADE8|nr:PTS sugar transporter subunit IIB [Enterococcus timonensis]